MEEKTENSLTEIREFLQSGVAPLKENEFKEFWMSLSEEEKNEFKQADLHHS